MDDFLRTGQEFPHIIAPTITGDVVDTYCLSGQKVWFIFYRYANCPMCNMHFDELQMQLGFLRDNNVRVVCFFESDKETFPKRFVEMNFPWLLMVADRDKQFYEKCGVENSWLKVFHPESVYGRVKAGVKGYKEKEIDGMLSTIPAHFLMWEGLRIAYTHYGRSLYDHLDWEVLKRFVLLDEEGFKNKYPPEVQGQASAGTEAAPAADQQTVTGDTLILDLDEDL